MITPRTKTWTDFSFFFYGVLEWVCKRQLKLSRLLIGRAFSDCLSRHNSLAFPVESVADIDFSCLIMFL